MCGRFTSLLSPELLAVIYEILAPEKLVLRYNIAPTQQIPIIRESTEGGRYLSSVRWGLVPHWAKDISIGNKMINARSETVHEKPAFRHAIKSQRCIVPASGYFEWSGKAPYYITTKDASPFSFAGIWESWRTPDGTPIETCAILTTPANSLMALIHDRMPVILRQGEFDQWLDPADKDILHLQNFYQPFPSELMTSWPVAKTVNSPANDIEECIRPLEPSLFA